ncbi:MAG: phosphoribosylanthranilate isomerase [Thermoleophilia bacterium]|nr:phosphoribosylanthranilate isomerase [Thermoleophilia bacterium]
MIKICGLARLDDVILARDLGAWALGFVFAPSPRRVTPAAARELAEGLVAAAQGTPGGAGGAACAGPASRRPSEACAGTALPLTVGVFGDVPAGEIARVVDEVGLDAVQLHSARGPGGDAVRAALKDCGRPVTIIQAVPVDPRETDAAALRRAIAAARRQVDVVLLDTQVGARFGGTGKAIPWSLAREAGEGQVLIAGGIGPYNVEAALHESLAWGVDVSSGVERSPGVKDPELLRQLFARAGAAWRATAGGVPGGAAPGSAPSSAPGTARAPAAQSGSAVVTIADRPQRGPDS